MPPAPPFKGGELVITYYLHIPYENEGKRFFRCFDFCLTNEGVENEHNEPTTRERQTKVILNNFKEEYAAKCPKTLGAIAERITEHCLIYFLSDKCPQIVIRDKEKIDLNELFKERIQEPTYTEQFSVKNESFEVVNLRLHLSEKTDHAVNFCANDRVVKTVKANAHIPDLHSRVSDESGTPFRYVALVKGQFLDDNLNSGSLGMAVQTGHNSICAHLFSTT